MREWLRTARQSKGLTMKDLSELLNISESYYSLIENGERQKKMDISLVDGLSKVLGIPFQKIVEFENKER